MVERPKTEDYKNEQALRGTGEIGESYGYLQYTDPTAYYYEKLKAQNNPYLRADMWAEAAKRGETNTLLSAIMSQPTSQVTIKNDNGEEVSKNISTNKYLDTWSDWEGYSDYDSYMLALTIPILDDEKKVDRTTTLEDGTEYSFGEYTDKEWAIKIFEEQVGHWEAEKVEEDKKNKTFWEHVGDFCKTVFVDIPLRILGGIVDFVGDIWNLLEGVANVFINWSGDVDAGDRFLYAFQNDDIFKQASDGLRKAAFELEYDTLLVNSVDAYEQGYRGPDGEVFDVGHTWIGQTVNGISQSIGYMLPSIAIQFIPGVGQGITAATTAAKVGTVGAKVGAYAAKNIGRLVFYTGIFSGNIKNTVNTAKMNGVSYQDLNAGTVIANAALKAVAQYAVEEALSWIVGASGLDRMFGQTYAGKLPKAGVKAPTAGSAAGRVIAGGVKGALKEGLEEFLQDSSDGLIDLVFGANGNTIFKQMGEETLNISNLLNSFVAGALTSVIMGTVGSAKFMWKRGYGIDADGKAYKLGFFQSIDYANSLRLMNEWQQTINDTGIKEDLRLDAAMKLATAYDTMSQIFKSLGESETITANKTLIAQAAVENTKKSALMQMSAPEYADKLMTDFMTNATEAQKKYISQKVEEAIKKAAESKEKGLKESLVTKFKQIFTRDSKVDSQNTVVDNVIQEEIVDTIDKVKAMAIVAHDGTYVGFSEDVLFVPETMLNNVNEALQMAEQRDAVEAVIPKLSQAQKRMLMRQFEKATGVTECTIEDAVTALLFDRNFYCSVLFLTAERRGYKPEAFQMLATIDQIVKNKLAPNMAKGNLREDIFMQIMQKIQANMQGGLINFCTKYNKVDLGEISNEVLSPEVKEVIRNNPNFLFTELINKCLYSYQTITQQDRDRLVKLINGIPQITTQLKQDYIAALDSKDAKKIADVGRAIAAQEYLFDGGREGMEKNKIAYLPTDTNERMVVTAVSGIEQFIGNTWDQLVSGEIDATKFNKEFIEYLNSTGGLDWGNDQLRLRFLDNLLFDKSSGTLALSVTGDILRVIDQHDFCKARYTGKNGIKNLREDIANGKVVTVSDIAKIKVAKDIGDIEIIFDAEDASDLRAEYRENEDAIVFTRKTRQITTILHEITHITQSIIAQNENTLRRKVKIGETTIDAQLKATGGNPNLFAMAPEQTQKGIINWLKENSPLFYQVVKNWESQFDIMYFTLDGEIKANATTHLLAKSGFTYTKDNSYIVAPDGTAFPLTLKGQRKRRTKSKTQTSTSTPVSFNDMYQQRLDLAEQELSRLQPGTEEYNQAQQRVNDIKQMMKITSFTSRSQEVGKEKATEPGRYISNKEARKSNLKYWIKKGRPIQIDPNVANFVIATTKDFDKLSPVIQRMIKDATLTAQTLGRYVDTAAHIDDFTFKAIAREFYNNEAAAKTTFKDLIDIYKHLAEYAAISELIPDGKTKQMSPAEIMQEYNTIKDQIEKDPALKEKFDKEVQFASQIKLENKEGKHYYDTPPIDPDQLHSLYFRLYDGTLESLYAINNLAKTLAYYQQFEGGAGVDSSGNVIQDTTSGEKKYPYGWQVNAKRANVVYEQNALDGIDKFDKVKTIRENYQATFIKKMQNLNQEATAENKAKILQEYQKGLGELANTLKTATDEQLDQMYLAALGTENRIISEDAYLDLVYRKDYRLKGETAADKAQRAKRDTKVTATSRGNRLAADLANLKKNFDKLPDNLKQYFSRTSKGYVFNTPDYSTMTQEEVTNLSNQLADARRVFKEERIKLQRAQRDAEQIKKRLDRMARQTFNKKGEKTDTKATTAKTMKEKITHKYKVHIHETNFSFTSNTEANNVVKNILNTQFSERAKSNVQGLISENQDIVITSGKEFFAQNAGLFLNSTLNEIEDAVAWFLDSQLQMQNATEDEFRMYQAIKQLFLGYVLSQSKADGVYSGLNNNLKQRIENELHKMASTAGTVLSHQNEILNLINPLMSMTQQSMEIDGVEVNEKLKSQLFDAIMSNDVEKINAAEQAIYDFIKAHQPKGQSFLRRITNFRSMAMLSSPLTWLRNKVSNFMLKRIYKISDAIGKRVFSKKHVIGQLKLDKQITPEIQAFINEHFIDNKLFDSFISNLSKYNPSDITERKNISEKATKEQIMAHMVLKSMYSDYYNNETFKSPFMKKMHEFIMKRLSDNNYVRASAVRTFGKILAEKGYDLSNNEVTDSIMNDFANAIGFAMAEYMHSENFFHDIERIIADKSEVGHFVYKLFMPYAASSWNWFKAMIKLSPIGLGRSIIQMARLEKNVAKAQANFLAGKTQITGELAEYMIRRDFGQGVVGTILWGVGIALAALGFVRLEDDDYGTPKLKIGNIEIDVSSIFGSSSLLAGAALITQIQKNGISWDGFVKGMNAMFDVWSDQLPIMDIVQMDMYSDGTFSLGLDQLGSILLSFIPNGVKWLAGGTYTGNLKKTTFLDRAMASIPGLGNFVQKKIDPYTGKEEDAGIIGILNRLIPYFSYHAASQNQSNTTALGLTKKMLNGTYSINGENFNVKGADLTAINQAYGKWNADDLTKFYNNQLGVKVKVGNTYKVLKYNQMDGDQQKRAVQSLMSNNAELAKILAWTKAGNKYYASSDVYNKLRKAGYTTNIYRGTKGFVKK